MLKGTSALATSQATSDEAEIPDVPAAELQRALAELPRASYPIVDALIMQRGRLRRDREFAGLSVLAARGGFALSIKQQNLRHSRLRSREGNHFLRLGHCDLALWSRKFSFDESNGALN